MLQPAMRIVWRKRRCLLVVPTMTSSKVRHSAFSNVALMISRMYSD